MFSLVWRAPGTTTATMKANQLSNTTHEQASQCGHKRADTPRPRPLQFTAKSMREVSKNITPALFTIQHQSKSPAAVVLTPRRPRNELATPVPPIKSTNSPRVPRTHERSSPALFVFTSGSEEELVHDDQPRKPTKPKHKPKKSKTRGSSQQVPRLPDPLPSTSTANVGVAVAPVSFWKRVSFASSSKISCSRRKRKIGGDENNESKRRKCELGDRVVDDVTSSRIDSTLGPVDSSEDEDDERFRSIFKEPFSWKPKTSILNLTMSFISKSSTPVPTPVKRPGLIQFQVPQNLVPQEKETEKSKSHTSKTSAVHSRIRKPFFGKQAALDPQVEDEEEPLLLDLVDEDDLPDLPTTTNNTTSHEPEPEPSASTSAQAKAVEKNKKRAEVQSSTAATPVTLKNKTDSAKRQALKQTTELLPPETKVRKIDVAKEKESSKSPYEAEKREKVQTKLPESEKPKPVPVVTKTKEKHSQSQSKRTEIGKSLAEELPPPAPALASSAKDKDATATGPGDKRLTEIKHKSQKTQTHVEVSHQACGNDYRNGSVDKGTETDRAVTADEGTNTVSVKYCDRGVDPIAKAATRDKSCLTDQPVGEYKSTQTDPEPNWQVQARASTSASTSNGYFTMNGSSAAPGPRFPEFNRYFNGNGRERSQSPVPSLHGTELHENGAANRLLVDERIEEDMVYAQVDEDLPAFRRLANAELQGEEMILSLSETRNNHVFTTSLRDVPEDRWTMVYPNVRMCVFNPDSSTRPEFQRHNVGYILIEPRTIRPYEESSDVGQVMYTCIQGSVVIKANQFSTSTRGTQLVTPIPLQAGGCILMGSRIPHLIENRTNQEAKLAFLMIPA